MAMEDLNAIVKDRLSNVFKNDTQETVARKLNTSQGNVSKWVNGQQVPTTDMLYEISKAYDVSVDWILGRSESKEIDGLVIEKLTYEQTARVLDRLLAYRNIIIPNLMEVDTGKMISDESEDEVGEDPKPMLLPKYDSDYLKIEDRVLSYLLRKRFKISEIDDEMLKWWKDTSLPLFKKLGLMNCKSNIQEAIDTKSWSVYKDADWIATIEELSGLSDDERLSLIKEAKNRVKEV